MNKKIIQKLLLEAKAKITEGLLSQDADVLFTEFEKYLMSTLEKTYRRTSPKVDEIALRIGKTIICEISEVPPQKRLAHVQRELIDLEVSELDRNSWNLAEQSLSDAPDLPTLQAQASANLEKILEIYRLLEQKGSEWQKQHGRTLSEARLDCEFVLGNHSKSSIRLGRTISYLQSTGNWPPSDDAGR